MTDSLGPQVGDVIERQRDPGILCLVTKRYDDFIEFTVLQGEEEGRKKIAGWRHTRVVARAS